MKGLIMDKRAIWEEARGGSFFGGGRERKRGGERERERNYFPCHE
jgi:hypothetical protein